MNATDKLAKIEALLADGRTVFVSTCTHTTKIDARCVARFAKIGARVFKVANGSLYLAAGKRWDCIDFATVTVR